MVNFGVTREELSGLEHVVQFRNKGSRFAYESMAAFNVDIIARVYFDKCVKDNGDTFQYRLIELSTIQPTFAVVRES
jgi:hypothetical protein